MNDLLLAGVMVVVMVLIVKAIATLVRAAMGGWASRGRPMGAADKGAVPYVPVDPWAPAAIEAGPAVSGVAVATLIWAAANALLAVAWIATAAVGRLTGESLSRTTVPTWEGSLWAACGMGGLLLVAASLAFVGAVGMLRRRPSGRRLIAWGHFLMGVLACVVGGAFVLMWSTGIAGESREWLAVAPYWALAMAAHLAVDVALGTAAQQVGRPEYLRKFNLKPIA